MGIADETDDIQFREPVLPRKNVKLKVNFAEPMEWVAKEAAGEYCGKSYKAVKLQLIVDDPEARCENEDALPKMIEDVFNVEKYPYGDKNTGELKWLGRSKLYQLESAFGFDPVFVDAEGNEMEPKVTRTGAKVAPKGAKRKLNQDFVSAYFLPDGTVTPDNWIDKTVYADVDIERSEQYGDKNKVKRYNKPPIV